MTTKLPHPGTRERPRQDEKREQSKATTNAKNSLYTILYGILIDENPDLTRVCRYVYTAKREVEDPREKIQIHFITATGNVVNN